jgi:hypothetical protein
MLALFAKHCYIIVSQSKVMVIEQSNYYKHCTLHVLRTRIAFL